MSDEERFENGERHNKSNGYDKIAQHVNKDHDKVSSLLSLQNGQGATTPTSPLSVISPPYLELVEFTWQSEIRLILELYFPTVILLLGSTMPNFVTASRIGREFGAVELDGFQLANLTVNLFTLSILQGLFSASDTLSPQAIGAGNYKEAGLIAMRGLLGSLILVVPICFLLSIFLQTILLFLRQDAEASRYASQWYLAFLLYVPFYALYNVTWKFLSAQHVMVPLMIGTLVSALLVLPVALHYCIKWFGFLGSAAALVLFSMSQAGITLLDVWYNQRHRPETWPGLGAWREALQWEPLLHYCRLGCGGIIAMSEWIYWEAMTLAIGTLGVLPLSVHSITTQVIMITFMAPLGLSIVLAIRIASTLPRNVQHAKNLAIWTMCVGTLIFCAAAWLMFVNQEFIHGLFTTNPNVLMECRLIWKHVCLYYCHLSVYILLTGIATGLGLQWTLGLIALVSLWGFGLPAAWYFGVVRVGTLEAVWAWYSPPYILINVLLLGVFVTRDWQNISEQVREREHKHGNVDVILANQVGHMESGLEKEEIMHQKVATQEHTPLMIKNGVPKLTRIIPVF